MKTLAIVVALFLVLSPVYVAAADSVLDVANQTEFYLVTTIYGTGSLGEHSTTWCVFPQKTAVHKAPFEIKGVLFQVKRSCSDPNSFAERKMPYQLRYTVLRTRGGYVFR